MLGFKDRVLCEIWPRGKTEDVTVDVFVSNRAANIDVLRYAKARVRESLPCLTIAVSAFNSEKVKPSGPHTDMRPSSTVQAGRT